MEFKLIGENNYNLIPVDTIFLNRGVSDYKRILTVSEKDTIHYSKLDQIKEAVDLTIKHITEKNKIFVKVDSDCDGYCSSAILINYLISVFPDANIEWKLHEAKEHGITIKEVPSDAGLVIIPDAGTNQFKEHKALRDNGIDVLVLDHHISDEKPSKYAVIVNNQYSKNYPNKNLSGAGIVYKFCQALDDKLGIQLSDEFLDLVAIGNIGDMMDLRELETRFYVKKGLEQIRNPLLQRLIEKQSFSMNSVVNIHNVAFYIVPLINAACRVATQLEKVDMMKAFLGSEELVFYKRSNEYESIQESVVRQLTNIKNRQDREKKKGFALIDKIISESMLHDNMFVIDVSEKLDKNLTGLVANQVVEKYKRPTVLLRKRTGKNVYGGSARGYVQSGIKDFRKLLLSTGTFNLCEGHPNAFGIEITEENIPKLKKYLKENYKQAIEFRDEFEVDFIIEGDALTQSLIMEIAKFRDEWGSVIKEPKIGIRNVTFYKNDIGLFGKKAKTLKGKTNGIEYVKKFFKQEDFETLFSGGETFVLDVVGTCKLNEWKGNKTPQISIEEMEITDVLEF